MCIEYVTTYCQVTKPSSDPPKPSRRKALPTSIPTNTWRLPVSLHPCQYWIQPSSLIFANLMGSFSFTETLTTGCCHQMGVCGPLRRLSVNAGKRKHPSNLPQAHLGSLEGSQMVSRVILKKSGRRDPQKEPNYFQGAFDLIGCRTLSARCQQIIDIHPAESQPVQPFWATYSDRAQHVWLRW